MPQLDDDTHLVSSILDRLLDDGSGVTPGGHFRALHHYKKAVSRDLEALLNTRRDFNDELPGDASQLNKSLLFYGLPDFTTYSVSYVNDQNKITRAVKWAIETFEPRLKSVRVTIVSPNEDNSTLHFLIEALLQVDPAPEPVAFDAVLKVTNSEYDVKASN